MAQRDRSEYHRQWAKDHKEERRIYNQQLHKQHKELRQEQMAIYRQDNPDYFKKHVKNRRQEMRKFIQEQKVGLSCKHCGNTDVRVLDFHHVDKSSKEASADTMVKQGWSKERILGELAKCETLCANCHRIHHWEERNGV
jgi:hypothetical protein